MKKKTTPQQAPVAKIDDAHVHALVRLTSRHSFTELVAVYLHLRGMTHTKYLTELTRDVLSPDPTRIGITNMLRGIEMGYEKITTERRALAKAIGQAALGLITSERFMVGQRVRHPSAHRIVDREGWVIGVDPTDESIEVWLDGRKHPCIHHHRFFKPMPEDSDETD